MDEDQPKRQPVFVKVDTLRPGTNGHNLVVKVIDCKVVVSRTRPDGSSVRIAECTVGDDTGVVTLTARNQQVDMMILGKLVYLRNAKIDMFKGSMRLAVDKWGLVQEADQEADFTPKTDFDLSAVEYELVPVTDE
mmetsp:Transcript_26794/g.44928  ORF Transcript_26794/g.44928 Transcript_26794/m.44928 type:complete len:135 (-) Transcript_26794:350-754(-)|eukprot:CAMPEP_0198212486 /NCGR_PEP_ID=MMETSP1445-20131203/26293_1 /TAXON_ID=36898 /ORGANISM="Pyramimonas sp., Strain CCMP2087" /LENGTH=134 /DNA_ID=CAMNT_0043886941 /DNA_START=89 /DNA_END=493 /DNA_ORIENTATION=+